MLALKGLVLVLVIVATSKAQVGGPGAGQGRGQGNGGPPDTIPCTNAADKMQACRCCMQSNCPDESWEEGYNGNCYKFFPASTVSDWNAALAHCKSLDADLVSIHSEEENDMVFWLARNGATTVADGPSVWIGFTDETTEGNWVWTDGSPVDYTKWFGGEPNNFHGNQNCAEMRVFHWSDFYNSKWDDRWCTDGGRSFICKITN
ncbi:echinoidin-like [Amphiura filiformis]|uniref:echinoidin-like n=1 Tax=Amphiura filiformis TaxID=82378 RepID=UPI003B214607